MVCNSIVVGVVLVVVSLLGTSVVGGLVLVDVSSSDNTCRACNSVTVIDGGWDG